VWRRQVGFVRGTRWPAGSSAGRRWHEQQDEVMDGFLVEPQNHGRAGTTWELSHEWQLAEATPSSRGFQWFTRKPPGSLVDPQSQVPGRRRTGLFHGAPRKTHGGGTGTAPLRHRGTSLSWRGQRTAPRKMDGDVAAGPTPCITSP
jgi:hypothetical protein